MEILGLSSSPSSGGAYALILTENGGNNRRLPIIIGTFEAQAIALELEHIKPPRPMTHDLFVSVVKSLDASIQSVYVNSLTEGTFYAQLILDVNGIEMIQDARPSDAIALAVRFNCPIFVDETVLEEAGINTENQNTDDEGLDQSEKDFDTKLNEQASNAINQIEELETRLQDAIASEDYELAAKIRDQLSRLKS